MTYAATIDENGQLTLPRELREQLDLTPNTSVELEERGGVITLSKKAPAEGKVSATDERIRCFDAAVQKLRPAMRASFVAEGWTSVDEYIDDMRGH